MDWLIKRASTLSEEELSNRGITGIPEDWPIEKYPYNEEVGNPNNLELISQEDLDLLIFNNQSSYDAWVASHQQIIQPAAPAPTPVTVTAQPDPAPFAQPLYRTKRDAISSLISIEKNTSQNIDYQITEERYVSGGDIIIENGEMGDYLTACVYDKDEVIPEAYRSFLCEAWPVVATYVLKAFVMVENPGTLTPGALTIHSIDTYPLNAKVTAGLYLRITYNAVDSGLTRRVGVNYYLTKKL